MRISDWHILNIIITNNNQYPIDFATAITAESNFTQCKKNICNYYLKNILRAVATLRAVADPRSGLSKRRGEKKGRGGEGEKGRRGEREKGRRGEWETGRRGEGSTGERVRGRRGEQ